MAQIEGIKQLSQTMKLTRTFHPVGQGAFYTEVFESKDGNKSVVVYDCGTVSTTDDFIRCGGQSVDVQIDTFKNRLPKDAQIDILFISHLHIDHINGIKKLVQKMRVKRLFLPMLSQDAVLVSRVSNFLALKRNAGTAEIDAAKELDVVIQFLYNSENTDYPEFIREFRDRIESKVFVTEQEDCELGQENAFWRYRMFNSIYETDSRSATLVKRLMEEGYISENKILNVDKILDNLDKVREAYTQVMGTTNDNLYTLVVESEPINNGDDKIGCVYFGDFVPQSIQLQRLFSVFDDYKSEIMTIQVPHHGSKYNWKSVMLEHTAIKNCIISVGYNNIYHHPSFYVIADILNHGANAHTVYENPNSKIEFSYSF